MILIPIDRGVPVLPAISFDGALQDIDNAEIIETVHARRQPMFRAHRVERRRAEPG